MLGFISTIYLDAKESQQLKEQYTRDVISLVSTDIYNLSNKDTESWEESIEKNLLSLEKNYQVNIYLLDKNMNEINKETDSDKKLSYRVIKEALELESNKPLYVDNVNYYRQGFIKNNLCCATIKYTKEKDIFILVNKTNDTLNQLFVKRVKENIAFMMLVVAFCLGVMTYAFYLYNKKLVEAENVDLLTNLPNRKRFMQLYESWINDRKRDRYSLFMLDVDCFKNINDTRGHLFGNEVLAIVSEILCENIGKDGMIARWGGDEFIGVYGGDGNNTKEKLESAKNDILKKKNVMGIKVTISVGVVESNDNLSLQQLTNRADISLYEAKHNGKNKVIIYNEI